MALARVALLLVTLCPVTSLRAQLAGQSFEVIPEASRATVGDSVTVRFRIRLHERDLLLDSVPILAETLPPGVRLFSVEKLSRAADRVFHGRARLGFYRPGRRQVPVFELPFMRIVEGIPRATLPSNSAPVDIHSMLPAGDPPLKDIKELERRPRLPWLPLALALVFLAVAATYLRIRRRRRVEAAGPVSPQEIAKLPVIQDTYDLAVERLHRVELQRWPARGNVARHYEDIVQALRDYLEEAEKVGAHERTTSELLWSLPPHLTTGGLRGRCHELLTDADLVKFAEVRPSEASAAEFLTRARAVLDAWHEARPVEESAHALR